MRPDAEQHSPLWHTHRAAPSCTRVGTGGRGHRRERGAACACKFCTCAHVRVHVCVRTRVGRRAGGRGGLTGCGTPALPALHVLVALLWDPDKVPLAGLAPLPGPAVGLLLDFGRDACCAALRQRAAPRRLAGRFFCAPRPPGRLFHILAASLKLGAVSGQLRVAVFATLVCAVERYAGGTVGAKGQSKAQHSTATATATAQHGCISSRVRRAAMQPAWRPGPLHSTSHTTTRDAGGVNTRPPLDLAGQP